MAKLPLGDDRAPPPAFGGSVTCRPVGAIFVIVLVVGNIVGAAWLITLVEHAGRRRKAQRRATPGTATSSKATIRCRAGGSVCSGSRLRSRSIYVVAYPSFGDFSLLGWNQVKQYDEEIARAEEIYGKLFAAVRGHADRGR